MAQLPIDPVLAIFIAASLSTWIRLAGQRPKLAYEPRSMVPWNRVAAVFVVAFVLIHVVSVVFGEPPEPPNADAGPPQKWIEQILLNSASQLAIFGTLLIGTVALSQATWHDVGLPDSAEQFTRDVRIGVVAWLAALLPVYTVQGLLASAVGQESSNPLIEMVREEAGASLLFAALVSAVVIAPICEEIGFRLLLQGWLEKYEDERFGWVNVPRVDDDTLVERPPAEEPQPRGWYGLPLGWFPILASSLVFSLAHFGFGPDPVALFLFALILGYVYQRTHRILPCIVAHALFNLTTLVMLALAVAQGAGAE